MKSVILFPGVLVAALAAFGMAHNIHGTSRTNNAVEQELFQTEGGDGYLFKISSSADDSSTIPSDAPSDAPSSQWPVASPGNTATTAMNLVNTATRCTGTQACRANRGTITGVGGYLCTDYRACDVNAGTIQDFGTADICTGRYSCLMNRGTISADSGIACTGGIVCRKNAGTIEGVNGGNVCTAPEVERTGSLQYSCDSNRGAIVSDGSQTVCSGGNVCNNVPSCVTVSGGCNSDGECNFPLGTTCCTDGPSGTPNCCEEGVAPTGLTAENCSYA